VREAQAVTGWVLAALFGEKSLQPFLRGDTIHRWSRRRGPRGRSSGKDRIRGAVSPLPERSFVRARWDKLPNERLTHVFHH
jgi:hypothetical protein